MAATSSSLSDSSTASTITVSQIPITTNQNIEADNLVDCIPTPPSSSSPKPIATVLGILPIFNKKHKSDIQCLVFSWVVGLLLVIAETAIALTLFLIPASNGSSSPHATPGIQDSSSSIRSSEVFPHKWEVVLFWILIGLTWLTWLIVLLFGISAIKRVSSKRMGMCFQCHIVLVVICLATVSFFVPDTPVNYHSSSVRSPPWQRNTLMLLDIIMTLCNILAAILAFRISANFGRSSFERPPTSQRENYNTFSNLQETK